MPTYILKMIHNGQILDTREIEAEDDDDAYKKAHAFKAIDVYQGVWAEVTLKVEPKEPAPT